MYLTRFRAYKIALPTQTNTYLGEEGPGASDNEIDAAKSLYKSIVKKSRHLGLESISYLVHALYPRFFHVHNSQSIVLTNILVCKLHNSVSLQISRRITKKLRFTKEGETDSVTMC